MVDTSNFTLSTPVKISIITPGIYVPELQTYTPLECYTSIEDCISILNRGVKINFPKQEKNEIYEKIEDILLEYEEKRKIALRKTGTIGASAEKAIDTIMEITDSKKTPEDIIQEQDTHIFDYKETANRIADDLKNDDFMFRVNHMFNNSEDRIEEEARNRKARERNNLRKKEALEMITMETETFNKLASTGYSTNSFDDKYDSMDFYDATVDNK